LIVGWVGFDKLEFGGLARKMVSSGLLVWNRNLSGRSSNKHTSAILKAIFQGHERALKLLSRVNCEGYKKNPIGDRVVRESFMEITGGLSGGR